MTTPSLPSWISITAGLALAAAIPGCADSALGGNPPGDASADCGNDCSGLDGGEVDDDRPDGATDPGTEFTDTGDLFAEVQTPGFVSATLHPSPAVQTSAPTRFAFGIPFPRGVIADAGQVRLTDAAGIALAAHIEETTRWRKLGDDDAPVSVRSVVIITELTFDDHDPVDVRIHFGDGASPALPSPGDVPSTWVAIDRGPDPDEYPASAAIAEPLVYATLPPSWLSASLLRNRVTVAGEEPAWAWYDQANREFGRTAANDVSAAVTAENRIDYISDSEPWLYDRALSFFSLYIRTGDVTWLRRAHRATQFYVGHLSADGYFDLKSYDDVKYSYGVSLLIDLMLTGDTSLRDPIERVASAASSWSPYSEGSNFWTERHQAYALLAALAAWETTGAQTHGNRARQLVAASVDHAANPPFGWPADGCLVHAQEQHAEGDSGPDDAVCSPWMSALLAEAVWRYFIVSEDRAALELLAGMGSAFAEHALYDGGVEHPNLAGYTMPYYLATSIYQFSDSGAWADWEHTCDVAGLIARAAWARKALGDDASELAATATDMLTACEANLDYWHRPDSDVNHGKAVWRLAPSRKFSWWFGTTSDMAWLLGDL